MSAVVSPDGRVSEPSRAPMNEAVMRAGGHDGSSLPACSATMYSAYQSGQFVIVLAVRALLVLAMRGRGAPERAREVGDAEAKVVAVRVHPPGNRVVTSCNSHPLPSGSLNVAYEK